MSAALAMNGTNLTQGAVFHELAYPRPFLSGRFSDDRQAGPVVLLLARVLVDLKSARKLLEHVPPSHTACLISSVMGTMRNSHDQTIIDSIARCR